LVKRTPTFTSRFSLFGNIGETIMQHAVESALLIALVVTAIIIKEVAEIGIYYLIISGIVVVGAYAVMYSCSIRLRQPP
jgi:hypothetical protein